MSQRRVGWAPIASAFVLLASVLIVTGSMPISEMYASPVRIPTDRQGWLKGRVTNAVTGLGLFATIAVWGPQLWAGSTDAQGHYAVRLVEGEYSVTALKGAHSRTAKRVVVSSTNPATVNFRVSIDSLGPRVWLETQRIRSRPTPSANQQPPTPIGTRSATPRSTPTLTRMRGPQLIAVKVGSGSPSLDSSNAGTYASRYDVIFGKIPSDLVDRLRTVNPDIILLQYILPGADQNKAKYPGSYYVRDAVSGLRVSKNAWWLLDFGDPVVRSARVHDTVRSAPAGVDGHWLDVSDPNWLNSPFGNQWHDENGKIADLGDLDGSWLPDLPTADKPRHANGTWHPRMLDFIKELKAASSGKLIIYNGLLGKTVLSANSAWGAYEEDWQHNTSGAAKEGIFVVSGGNPLSESDWKWWLDKAKRAIDQGKYMHFFPQIGNDPNLRKYAFASYLLLADGKYAWFDVQWPWYYDASLHDVDYGAPLGAYQTVSTANGPIYKRQFSKATVWVNPASVTRTADGKALGPQSAIIEMTSN